MKIVALVIMLFGLLTAAYGVAEVGPKYHDVNSDWLSASMSRGDYSPEAAAKERRLGEKRDALRARGQQYVLAAVACALLSSIVAIALRKKPGMKPVWTIVGAVLTLVLAGFMAGHHGVF
ncbi:MAG: hypothetical protein ACHREM_23435 [Polyangiales bacterium]